MSSSDFLDVVESLLRKIAVGRGAGTGARSLYQPLRETMFSRRKSRYFPDALTGMSEQLMPQDMFVAIREALRKATDNVGNAVLGADDLLLLDQAWEDYQRTTLFAAGVVPKRFELLLRGRDRPELATPEGFVDFLYDTIYTPMLRGNHRLCEKNIDAILRGFRGRHPVFSQALRVREEQYALLLATAQFCLYRMGNSREFGFIQVMQRRYEASPSDVLFHSILMHQHFHDVLSGAAEVALEATLNGRNQVWGRKYGPGIAYGRAAYLATMRGIDLKDRAASFCGFSVEYALNHSIQDCLARERPLEAAFGKTIELESHAIFGRVDEALEGAVQLRHELQQLPEHSPHLEVQVAFSEARAYFSASSNGKDKRFLLAAGGKLSEISKIKKGLGGASVKKEFIEFSSVVRNVTLDRIGTIAHMGD